MMRSSLSVKPITDLFNRVLTSPKLSLSLILTARDVDKIIIQCVGADGGVANCS